MARVSEHEVLEALKTVQDPDRGQDVVSLGMISGLEACAMNTAVNRKTTQITSFR